MYERESVERLQQLTEQLLGKGVVLADLDSAAKLEMACLCKTREIEELESSITDIKNAIIKAVEDLHNSAAKGSQTAKDLANAELREIAVRDKLKENSKFMDLAGRAKKLNRSCPA
jgi:hypothetical protein